MPEPASECELSEEDEPEPTGEVEPVPGLELPEPIDSAELLPVAPLEPLDPLLPDPVPSDPLLEPVVPVVPLVPLEPLDPPELLLSLDGLELPDVPDVDPSVVELPLDPLWPGLVLDVLESPRALLLEGPPALPPLCA